MSLCPSIVAGNGESLDYYFALAGAGQVLSQSGDTVSLSGGGGSVNIATTTSVASSAQKTTAITYNGGLLETNISGILNVGLGSPIGSTRVEGGNVVISRTDAPPAIEFTSGANTATIEYDAFGLVLNSGVGPMNLITNGIGDTFDVTSYDKLTLTSTAGVVEIKAPANEIFINAGSGGLYLDGTNITATATNNAVFGSSTGEVQINADTGIYQTANGAGSQIALTATGGPITITGNGSVGIESQTLNVDLTAAANINMTAAADISIQANGNPAAQVSIGTSNTVFNMDESTGGITLTAPNSLNLTASVGDLVLTGTNIESATANGASSQYLRIKLNGTFYKILLLND